MKRKSKLLIVSLTALLSLTLSGNTFAASAKSKALKAYNKFLSSGSLSIPYAYEKVNKSNCRFSVIYLDKDSTPELVVSWQGGEYGNPWTNGALYRYSGGKVVRVGTLSIMYKLKYVKKKGYLKDQWMESSGSGYTYTKYSGKKLKQVSKSKAKGHFTTVKFHKNNASNRRKYL